MFVIGNLRSIRAALLLLAGALIAGGCGSGIDLATVEGRVTKNGQPLADHWVRFTPTAGGRSGNGRTDIDGRYELAYTYRDKGARVGPNRVEVGSGGQLDERGNELKTPKTIFTTEKTVESGENIIDIVIDER
jgi:hypothetical protein